MKTRKLIPLGKWIHVFNDVGSNAFEKYQMNPSKICLLLLVFVGMYSLM